MLSGKDVARILGYAKPPNAIVMHVDEDDSLKQGLIDSLGRTQQTIFINESGLYSLILSGKDVERILGYRETAKAIRDHIDEEDKGVSILDTPGGTQNMIFINESGLYSLILSGKDVARILGYANASKALFDHVDDEDKLNNESLSN